MKKYNFNRSRLADKLCDKHGVRVNVVMTTGASLFPAARVFKAAGASAVTGLVVTRTE